MARMSVVRKVRMANELALNRTAGEVRLAVRVALQDTFGFWRRTIAPVHFTRHAFSRYPSEYRGNYKRGYTGVNPLAGKTTAEIILATPRERSLRTLWYEIRRWKNSDKPLVKSGAVRREILRGSVTFNSSNTTLVAHWPNLPTVINRKGREVTYFYAYHKRRDLPWKGGPTWDKAAALLAMNESDLRQLQDAFDKALERRLRRRGQKLGGFAVVKDGVLV